MWDLLAIWNDKASKKDIEVSVITSYFNTKNDSVYLIAVAKDGKFVNDHIANFTSKNEVGFLLRI